MPSRAGYRLSPYCILHVDPGGDTATLVHALYGSRFDVAVELLPAPAALSGGASMDSVLGPLSPGARDAIHVLVEEEVLIAAEEGPDLSDPDPFRDRLNPIELAVHRGFNEGGYVPEELDPRNAPAVAKDLAGVRTIPLQPHAASDARMDLSTCLHTRRSMRGYGDTSLTKRDFEQFMQLCAGAQALVETPASGSVSFGPYPSAGGLHPLEIYPVVYGVESIEPGIYHYHSFKHQLTQLQSDPEHRAALMALARHKMGVRSHAGPAVLFLITAVFGRTCWKYRGMAYQAILMETGALYQTMYLVATMLGLAPCAVGAFPERATAEMLGIDSRDEAQVGMFALGVPEQSATPPARVTAVRLLGRSPFSRSPRDGAVELTFVDGSREIIPSDRLQIESPPGEPGGCIIKGGRGTAALDESLRRELLGLLGARPE